MKQYKNIIRLLLVCIIANVTGTIFAEEINIQTVKNEGTALHDENNKDDSIDLTFEDSLSCLDRNYAMLAGKNEIDQRMHERWAAFGLFFPRVTLNSRYTIMNDPIVMDLNDIRTAMIESESSVGSGGNAAMQQYLEQSLNEQIPPFEKTIQDKEYFNFDVTVNQPLFTGGKILAANRAAKARIKESDSRMKQTKAQLVTELVERYYGLSLHMVVATVRQDVLDGMEKHLSQARKLEETGMIAKSERLHAEVARAKADREVKASLRDIDIAQVALKNTVSIERNIVPKSKLFIINDIEPVSFFQEKALAFSPMLMQIEATCELAKQNYMKEIGNNSPDIYLFGKRELYTEDLTMLQPKWAVGAGATWTISEGLAGTRNVLAAKKILEKAGNIEKKAKKDILTLVQKDYDELMKQLEQYKSTESSYKSAEEYLRVSERAFEEGMATSLTVVDAKLAFSQVKIERLKAVYEFDVALARCLEVCGISNEFINYRNKADMEVDFQ